MKGEGFHIYCLPRSDLKDYYSLLPLDMRDMAVIPEIRILAAIEEDNRRPAGILIFRFTESMSGAEAMGGEILWLFVARGYRRRGLGTGLLSRMTRMLSAEGAGIRGGGKNSHRSWRIGARAGGHGRSVFRIEKKY